MSTLNTSILNDAYREGNIIPIGVAPSTNQLAEGLLILSRLVRGILGYKMGENLQDWYVPQPQRTALVAGNWPQFPGEYDYFSLYGTSLSQSVFPYPPNNRRIVYGGTAQTVYFPEKPNAGGQMSLIQASGAGDGGQTGDILTLNGNGRTIQGANTQTFSFNSGAGNTPFAPVRWFFRDDLSDWVLIADPTDGNGSASTDFIPYPEEFDDFFICAASKRLAARYNKVVSKETIERALEMESAFLARYRQPTVTVYGSDNFPRSYQSYIAGQWWW